MGGWKIYAFKEKLKLLREKLWTWNRGVFSYVDLNIENIIQELNALDDFVGSIEQSS